MATSTPQSRSTVVVACPPVPATGQVEPVPLSNSQALDITKAVLQALQPLWAGCHLDISSFVGA